MPHTCQVIITRGKNKGQACGVVNKKCRHRNIECPHCGTRFTVETSFIRHRTQCRIPIIIPIRTESMTAHIEPTEPIEHTERTERNEPSEPVVNKLLRKIEHLEKELELVKNKPEVHHHWNIVLGMNFFEELVSKMGTDHAINFLTDIATDGGPVDVINKLYLEGNSPTSYPIACQGDTHFRYIDADHRLIDDKGGHGISKIVTSGVHEALILAANEAIHQQVMSQDYDHFNIAPIQKYVADMRKSLPQDRIISELARMTRIPNHPFFKDPDA